MHASNLYSLECQFSGILWKAESEMTMWEILTVCCLNSAEQRSFSLHSLRSKPEKQRGDIWGLLHLSFQRYSQTPTCLVQAPRPLYFWQINRSQGHPVSPYFWTCSRSHKHTHAIFLNKHKDTSSPKTQSLKLNTLSPTRTYTHIHTPSLMYRQTKGGLSARRTLIWFHCEGGSTQQAMSMGVRLCTRERVHVCVRTRVCVCVSLL